MCGHGLHMHRTDAYPHPFLEGGGGRGDVGDILRGKGGGM